MTEKSSQEAASPATITLEDLAASISRDFELPQKQAEVVLVNVVGRVTEHLKKGGRVHINGLGILEVQERPPRMGRDPVSGEPIKLEATMEVSFRAAESLNHAVCGGGDHTWKKA
jgi:DNA-binding protein HU-beta